MLRQASVIAPCAELIAKAGIAIALAKARRQQGEMTAIRRRIDDLLQLRVHWNSQRDAGLILGLLRAGALSVCASGFYSTIKSNRERP
jgi:hypothetical protein